MSEGAGTADRPTRADGPVLIVDDDPSVVASLSLLLKQNGLVARSAADPDEALARLEQEPFRLVLQDMNFSRETSGREGIELLQAVRARRPDLPVVLITAWGSIALAVEGIKAGAADFVTKPWSNAQLLQTVRTILRLEETGGRAPAAGTPDRARLEAAHDLDGLLGGDPEFLRVVELACRVAATDAPVLISGASGTGKELIAEAIHRNSPRHDRPFVKVNLGGISSTLFESEMFGHVRGAFTDARADREGRFAHADGGTIFLDEIGELDPASQVKLLRVLQDQTFEVLGSSRTRRVDVRIVSATNRDLATEVAAGRFREDLLYRLNLISLRLPDLSARRGDVALLARAFLARSRAAHGGGPRELTADAERWLARQPWPGNVRQLRQTIERAVLVAGGERLDAADLERLSALDGQAREREGGLPQPGSMTLDELERAMIERSLRHYDGNLTRVAEALGLSRAALYRRLEKFGLGPRE